MQEYFYNLMAKAVDSLPNLFTALVILGFSVYLAKVFSALLSRVLARQNAAIGISQLLSQTLKWIVISFGVIAALQRFFDVTAFLAGLGILGFTIGFALQDIMQNFVSGIILLVQQPLKIDEYVKAAGYEGTVTKIDLRTTEMKTVDGLIVFLPNTDILSQAIINYTRAGCLRAEISVGVAYDTNLNNVNEIILNAIKDAPGYVDTPSPSVLFHTFGASSIELTVYFWVDTTLFSTRAVKDAALKKIKEAFEREGIEIPFPIRTLRLSGETINIGK
ncbi:MAG: mechanosensitive ion channel [Anaerolineales bacterium]|nr:mechanosensitive ion channel [Anaerolineales bacterium]